MTSSKQLQTQVRAVADELVAVAECRYNFYTGEIVDCVDDIDDGEAENHNDNYNSDFDGGFYRYFEDALDIEYRVDAGLRYKGAFITVAVGGPSIEVDTLSHKVKGYWWGDKAEVEFWSGVAAQIDEVFEDYFNCARGSY